jgi:hypothetical protein
MSLPLVPIETRGSEAVIAAQGNDPVCQFQDILDTASL